MARLSMSTPAPWHLGRPGHLDMACDILTLLCGTIGPLSICQLINFNFAMLPHLRTVHAARRLPGECAQKLSGATAYCWDAANIHSSSLPTCILLSLISYHPFQGSGGCSFWERPFLLEASTNPTSLYSSRAGLCET